MDTCCGIDMEFAFADAPDPDPMAGFPDPTAEFPGAIPVEVPMAPSDGLPMGGMVLATVDVVGGTMPPPDGVPREPSSRFCRNNTEWSIVIFRKGKSVTNLEKERHFDYKWVLINSRT